MRTEPASIRPAAGALAAALATSLLLASCAGIGERRASGPGSDSPVAATPDPGLSPAEPTPLPVEPRDGLVDVHRQPWEEVVVLDARTVEVRFWGGVETCYGLAGVGVDYRKRSVVITLHTGRVPTAEVCIEIALLKATRVELEEPLGGRRLVDGATEKA